jgi:hypothetical protein
MVVHHAKRYVAFFVAQILLLALTSHAAPAVRVTLQVDKAQLKVGEIATARVFAEIVPEQLATTTQIVTWYVDLLNSNSSAIQIQPGTVVVPASDSQGGTSSKGTIGSAGDLRAVYDTFFNNVGAGHDAAVELFSVQLKAVAVGTANFSVGAGTGAPALAEDFIVGTTTGDAVYGGLYDTAKVQITSFNNLPPTLDPIPEVSVNEGSAVTFTLVGHDADIGQTLVYSVVGTAPTGSTLGAATGVFTWTPGENDGPQTRIVQFRVADTGSPSMSATNSVRIAVKEVNRPPVLQVPATITGGELSSITGTATATDPDFLLGQTPTTNRFTFSLQNPPAGAAINPTTGVFSWTPTEAQGPGSYTIRVVVADDGVPALSDSKTFTVNVTEQNSAPALDGPPNPTVNEGATLTVSFVPTDLDLPANPLTFRLLSGPPGIILDTATGLLTWTPTEAQGPGAYTIRVEVSDNQSPPLTASDAFDVTVREVNSPPVLDVLSDRTVTELTPLSFTAIARDSDLPGQTFTFSLDSAPAGASINPTTGAFTWTPTEAQGPGRYTVAVRVTDNGSPATSDTKSFDVVVNENTSPPVLVTPAGQGTQSIPELVAKTIQFTATDPDLPANLITFSMLNAPPGASIDPATGLFLWTPTEAQGPGVFTFQIVAADNGAPARAATNTINFTVTEANAAPQIDPIENQSANELAQLTIAVVARDTDLPAQTLTYSLTSPPPGVAINPTTGVLTWTPTEAQGPGQFSITVRVTESGTAALFATRTFSVTVNEVNADQVFGAALPITFSEMTAINARFTATDSDLVSGQTPNTNSLTYSLLDAPSGMTINAQSGVLSWTPTEVQGPATYQVRAAVTDNGIPPLSATATLTVNVTEVNRAPSIIVPSPANRTIPELTTLEATFSGSDPDLPANTLSFALISAPPGVQINPATGALAWTPSEAQGPGTYSIFVAVSDNQSPALRSTNNINVTVTDVNSKPTLSGIPDFTLAVGSAINFIAAATDSDIPAQTLVYSMDSGPAGAAINASSGVFTWTPSVAQGGQQFTITLRAAENSAGALFDTRTFKISVTGASSANTAPIILNPPNQNATVGATLTVPIVATDADVPANTLTFALVAAPAGVSINPGTGVLTWTPTAAQVGQSQIQVKVTDNGIPPLSNTNLFTVTVTGGNATPATLRLISVAAGGTTLRVEGPAGSSYDLEYSTDLINWAPLTSVSLAAQTFITYLDVAHALGQPMGFYRAKSAGGTVTPAAPTVGLQSIGPGGLTVRVTGEAGRTYRIQLSTDLIDWSPLGTVSITSGTIADFIDTAQPTRGTKAFYRAVVP